ncbi:hypothetical protein QVD17_41332 [Tagetes erecta]|uniref:Uncharacterized protein n=1 Tax=Tagetes erecta TaxID=13708 RepID=A0AAD8JSX2_TARER|nr:hypothetical protein QVD17_41332 [Tagetes erecta]
MDDYVLRSSDHLILAISKEGGEEICVALETHMNDVMLQRLSKTCSTSEIWAHDLSDAFEEPQKDAEQDFESKTKQNVAKLKKHEQELANLQAVYDKKLLLRNHYSSIIECYQPGLMGGSNQGGMLGMGFDPTSQNGPVYDPIFQICKEKSECTVD